MDAGHAGERPRSSLLSSSAAETTLGFSASREFDKLLSSKTWVRVRGPPLLRAGSKVASTQEHPENDNSTFLDSTKRRQKVRPDTPKWSPKAIPNSWKIKRKRGLDFVFTIIHQNVMNILVIRNSKIVFSHGEFPFFKVSSTFKKLTKYMPKCSQHV